MTGVKRTRHRYLPLLLLLLAVSFVLRVLAGLLGVWIPVSALTSGWSVAAAMIMGLLVLLSISVRQLDIRNARPILMKEMRSRMRGVRAPLLLLLMAGIAVLITLVILALGWSEYSGGVEEMNSQLAEIGQALFTVVSIITAVIVALVTTAIASGVVTHEYEMQTFDFLLITPVSEAGILSGKLLAALSFAAMLVICTVPITALAFFFGGVAPWQVFAVPAYILIGAYSLAVISLYCSTRFRKMAVATTVAYVTCLLLLVTQPMLYLFVNNGLFFLYDAFGFIIVGMAALIILALLIIGILTGTSALIKRERNQRFFLLKRLTGILLSVLALDVIIFVLCNGIGSSTDESITFGNPAVSLLVLLDNDHLFYYYSLGDDWSMVLISLGAMLLLAQFSFRKARYIIRSQRVQPPKPDGPRLKFRLKPW